MNCFPYAKPSLWFFCLLLLALPVVGQRGRDVGMSDEERVRRREDEIRRAGHRRLDDLSKVPADAPKAKPDFYNKKLTVAQKKLVSPAAEVQAAYQDFLRQDHTGLIRLLPRGKYEYTDTVDADRDPDLVLPIRGGGAFYSFAEKTHAFGPWSEISLNDGLLLTGFVSESLGLLVPLGDVPLQSVTPQSAGVDVLTRLVPSPHYASAQENRNRNFQGFHVGGFFYSSVLRAIPNTTYVLRSMIYKREGRLVNVPGSSATVYIRHPDEYVGTDALIAFRIVRADEDGSLTLLWKRLQKFHPPKLKKENRQTAAKL